MFPFEKHNKINFFFVTKYSINWRRFSGLSSFLVGVGLNEKKSLIGICALANLSIKPLDAQALLKARELK